MKKFITLLILLFLFVGYAGAVAGVTISTTPHAKYGPNIGFLNPGTIKAADLWATDDLEVGDDADFGDDVDIAGTLTVAVLSPDATTASNELGHDLTVLALTDITAASGAEIFDYSLSTSPFLTSQGLNTIGGITWMTGATNNLYGALLAGGAITGASVASNATIRATTLLSTAGDGRIEDDFLVDDDFFVDGTATVSDLSVNTTTTMTGIATFTAAPLFNAGFVLPAGVDITATSGGSDLDLSAATTGIFKTPGGAVTIGPGAVGISGAVTMGANKGIAMTSGTGAMDFSLGTGVFKTTTGAVTIGPGLTTMSGGLALPVNATTTLATTLTAANTKTVYGIDASGGDVVLTLPDAATVTGRMYMVASSANAGGNYARVKATAGKFGGSNGVAAATGLKSTDDAGSGITLVSDGSNYLIMGQYGTWASG